MPSRKVLLRLAALAYLGNRCSNPDCRWLNADGTFGCTDPDMLHIDHDDGSGAQERKALGDIAIYYRVLEDKEGKYKALCANCNWKKRCLNREHIVPPHTPEARAKIGRGRTGWKHSAAARKRMSFAAKNRGRLAWSGASKSKRIKDK